MAWTTPRTWVAGEVVTAAYMNANVRDNTNHIYGSTWTTFSPTCTQSGSVSLTTATGRYRHVGYLCNLFIFLNFSGTGTAGNAIVIGSVPSAIAPRSSGNPASGDANTPVGVGYYHDSGVGPYPVHCFFATSSTLQMHRTDTLGGTTVGLDPNIAVAAADSLQLSIAYETNAAS